MNWAFSSPRVSWHLWDAAEALQPARSTRRLRPEAMDHLGSILLGSFGARWVCWNFPPCSALWDAQMWASGTQLCSAWSGRVTLTRRLSSTEKTDYILYIRLCGIKHCWIWKANYFSGRAYRIFFPLKSLMTVFMGKFPWVPPRLKAFFMRQMEMFFPRVSNI